MMCVTHRRASRRSSFETTLDKRNGLCFARKFDNALVGPVGFWTGYVSVHHAVVLCVREDRLIILHALCFWEAQGQVAPQEPCFAENQHWREVAFRFKEYQILLGDEEKGG